MIGPVFWADPVLDPEPSEWIRWTQSGGSTGVDGWWPWEAETVVPLPDSDAPEWIRSGDNPDILGARSLGEIQEGTGEEIWLILVARLFSLDIAICTPPPGGALSEIWTYDSWPEARTAFEIWPERTEVTERWVRHRWPGRTGQLGYGDSERRQRQERAVGR